MPDPEDVSVYRLLLAMVCAVVDRTDAIAIKTVETVGGAAFVVSVHTEDIGKLIGEQGQNARSIRTIVGGAGMKLGRRFIVVIEEDRTHPR